MHVTHAAHYYHVSIFINIFGLFSRGDRRTISFRSFSFRSQEAYFFLSSSSWAALPWAAYFFLSSPNVSECSPVSECSTKLKCRAFLKDLVSGAQKFKGRAQNLLRNFWDFCEIFRRAENSPGRARKIQGHINLHVFRRQAFWGAFMGVGIFEKQILKILQKFWKKFFSKKNFFLEKKSFSRENW